MGLWWTEAWRANADEGNSGRTESGRREAKKWQQRSARNFSCFTFLLQVPFTLFYRQKVTAPLPTYPCCTHNSILETMPVLSPSISAVIRTQPTPESSWHTSWWLTGNPLTLCWLSWCPGAEKNEGWEAGCCSDVMDVFWVTESQTGGLKAQLMLPLLDWLWRSG